MTYLRIAAGDQAYLLRRPASLVFVETADAEALAIFVGEGSSEISLDAIGDRLTAAGFNAPPFVAIEWGARARFMAFGDVQVQTDHPALPMLSAAGSGTWVERSVGSVATVTVSMGATADPNTSLDAGIVQAGGFELALDLNLATPPHAEPQPAPATDEPPAVPEPDPPAEPASFTPFPPEPAPPVPELVEPEDSTAAPDLEPELSTRPYDEPAKPEQSSSRLLDPAVIGVQPEPAAEADAPESSGQDSPGTGRPKVMARRCPNGHLNPSALADCEICGAALDFGDIVEEVDRPPLGTFVFDDGTRIDVLDSMVLGREPSVFSGADDLHYVTLSDEHGLMSRAHLEVRLHRWTVEIRDLGTANGTTVTTGRSTVELRGDEYMAIEPGVIVTMASKSFEYVGRDA